MRERLLRWLLGGFYERSVAAAAGVDQLREELSAAQRQTLLEEAERRRLNTEQSALSEAHKLQRELFADALPRADAAAALTADLQQQFHHHFDALYRRQQELEATQAEAADPVGPGFDYAAFEDRFRGSVELIKSRQQVYLELLAKQAPVADLGCGRGELLALLAGRKISATGVEANPELFSRCLEQGLQVENADIFSWLKEQPDAAWGALTLLQVVEHYPIRKIRELLKSAARVLRPGGLLLIETINPQCPQALSWFHLDPTHIRPVYPEMLQFLFAESGFASIEVRYQLPVSGDPAGPATQQTGADYAIWGRNL